ncbi:hypothetical protein [Sphingomonas sp. 3-13AW]|uniref:hypothetical protein n=1 Tax=Sphingomonas sp. 3-13AW TaxID=3050450 RepID=UPI003BB6E08C
MPLDINSRLESLRARRRGVDAVNNGRITADFASDILRKSVVQESWQRRASNQPHTRYALGAMQAVDADYTQKSKDEARRVENQLRNGLGISFETRLQGSVPLDIHIRGVSDVDLLVLRTDFFTYNPYGARAAYYTPSTLTSLGALTHLRNECEDLLKRRYWGAKVDCAGGKCISLSGGAFERPVDVVPAHWNNTAAYQALNQEHDRGVTILDKKVPTTVDNLPFTHMKRVHDRDVEYYGGLKKAIRLVKNVKNDAANSSSAAKLSSFDVAGLLYHADPTPLRAGGVNELYILREAQRFFDWCYRNKDEAGRLQTPDGSRAVLNSSEKHSAVLSISAELDDLAKQVAVEQGLTSTNLNWNSIYYTLGNARVPAAA